MKNYKLTIQYEGTKYNGWQRQGNTKNTIQEKFENILFRMTGHKTEINASGRTDAGVHAIAQTANFKCDVDMSICEIKEYINHYLPTDIAVVDIEEAEERFHSRLNTKSKTYIYTICAGVKPDVFTRRTVYYTKNIPDIEKMRNAAKRLLGTHDFKGFSSVGRVKKSTVRTINYIEIADNNGYIDITINGNGFLYNMVRIICGTLYEIGLGKMNEKIIDEIFESNIREKAGITLPPEGLKLAAVYY